VPAGTAIVVLAFTIDLLLVKPFFYKTSIKIHNAWMELEVFLLQKKKKQ
jgi:hypothetical protein